MVGLDEFCPRMGDRARRAFAARESAHILVNMERMIDVDDACLEAARQRLGTSTIKDTVNAALRQAADAAPSPKELDAALDALNGLEFASRQKAWR